MKKLILGLFLIVGTSSYALAGTVEIDKDLETEQQETFKGNCYMQVIVNHENTCGQYLYSVASPKYSVNCQQGQAEGTTSTYYEVRTEAGWNPGSDPNPSTNCN
ncbi:hypothetical protein [Chryseobacterium sp.]|uniref:hypothetical protein n=1 Tax=Chryseobacterium sp. TaxID=1871047 RepID=UPI00333F3E12